MDAETFDKNYIVSVHVFKTENKVNQVVFSLKMSCLHRGPHVQRGRGVGSTLSAMFKDVFPAAQIIGKKVLASPLTKKVLKTAKRSAVDAGLQIAKDVLHGKKLKESLNENVSSAKKSVKKSLLTALSNAESPSITEEKPVCKRKVAVRRGKKKQYSDIFEQKFV